MNEPQTAALLVAHCRPSFYFRLEEGEVEAGDEVVQVEAGPERLTVSAVNALLYRPGHPRSQLEPALRIPALSGGWRRSRAESTANALVNRRFNKRRQMRWSPKGAQRVLQARVAILDGRLRDGCLKLTHDPQNCSTLSHVLFTKFGSAKSGGRQNGRHGIASLNLGMCKSWQLSRLRSYPRNRTYARRQTGAQNCREERHVFRQNVGLISLEFIAQPGAVADAVRIALPSKVGPGGHQLVG